MDINCAFAGENMCNGIYGGTKCAHDCTFKQTEAEREVKTRAWVARLRKLPEYKQNYISDKYYDGNKPWRNANATLPGVLAAVLK